MSPNGSGVTALAVVGEVTEVDILFVVENIKRGNTETVYPNATGRYMGSSLLGGTIAHTSELPRPRMVPLTKYRK
jgi:hypothetical protein